MSVPELPMPNKDEVFENELLPHIEALNTFAFHLTYDESTAKDLVQETYLKAFRALESYETGTNAKAWLFKILKNAYINEYRKSARRPTKLDFEEFIGFRDRDDASPTEYQDLREDMFERLMGDEVTTAINALPIDYRTVLLLCDVEGFKYEEIAHIIGVPIGTVRSRLHRARNALKEKLRTYAEGLGYKDKRK